jgi:hypothetical protein
MARSRRKPPKPAPQEPGQPIPSDHLDPVAPDNHFEIGVDPGTHVETSEQPDENWSREKLAWYATRAEERAQRYAHGESAERFRLGKALHFAHQKTPHGQWHAWVGNTFTFTRMTAWRAEQLYLRATEKYGERAEEACGNQSINDLYLNLRLKKKDKWLNEADGEQTPARAEAQGTQPATKKDQAKKRRSKRTQSQPEPAKKPQGTLPDDPRRHAEESCKQEYPTDGLILMAADGLDDGLTRFETTMPNEEKAIRLTLVRLEQIKDRADRLIRRCEAKRGASR